MPKPIKDLSGQKFARLVVIEFAPTGRKNTHWRCVCSCGSESVVSGSDLKSGNTKSCGCFKLDKFTKHGLSHTTEYKIWNAMVLRCNNVESKDYDSYGGRGITVSERWLTFENFLKDMGERPKDRTLDRIDNNSGYSKENCRWADGITQGSNKRNNVFLTAFGRTLTAAQWSRELSIKREILYKRLGQGWSHEDTLSRPVQKRKTAIKDS